jgi:alpha-glucosidase
MRKLFGTAALVAAAGTASAQPIIVAGGKVTVTVHSDGGRLAYEVAMDRKPVIERSNLGIKLDGVDLGAGVTVGKIEPYKIDEKYPWRGIKSEAVNRAAGVKVPLKHKGGVAYTLEVRAFEDAAAFRFVVPGAPTESRVPDAAMAFQVPADSIVWHHGIEAGHYEDLWEDHPVQEIAADTWVAPPMTFKLPGSAGYASILEADLRNYAGMALQAAGGRVFREVLAHDHPPARTFQYGAEAAARLKIPAAITGTISTPWRVVIAGPDLNTLVNSDAVPNLCPPPDPKLFPQGIKTAWVKPGRAVWDYVDRMDLVPMPDVADRQEASRIRRREQIRAFSKLAGELGFEHNVLEGFWRSWPEAELREMVEYSRERGVGIWVWIHSRVLFDAAERKKLFAHLHSVGVVGMKIDFFDHEAKEWIDLYQAILREAAENELMVNFHGANKPAGEPRMWPNEMTREAIKGSESSRVMAWGPHNTTWPFTRLLAGHAELTPILFGTRRRETSWSHQIATAAVLTAPLLTYAANPKQLLENPAADIIKSIPATWDQTIVLPPSEIGDLALFARRDGQKWFVAALNNELVKELKVATPFLEKGRKYQLAIVKDEIGVTAPADKVIVENGTFTGGETLAVSVRGGGGFVARLTPQ